MSWCPEKRYLRRLGGDRYAYLANQSSRRSPRPTRTRSIHCQSHSGGRLLELDGDDDLVFAGDFNELISAAQEFITGSRATPVLDRVLATVLFTDIAGSTRLAADLGDNRWHELLNQHDDRVDRLVERFRGRLVKSTGDGTLVTFDVVTVSSVLDLIAVLVLPWRWLGIGNPFHLGSHLYQMHLPLLMTALIALAVPPSSWPVSQRGISANSRLAHIGWNDIACLVVASSSGLRSRRDVPL